MLYLGFLTVFAVWPRTTSKNKRSMGLVWLTTEGHVDSSAILITRHIADKIHTTQKVEHTKYTYGENDHYSNINPSTLL